MRYILMILSLIIATQLASCGSGDDKYDGFGPIVGTFEVKDMGCNSYHHTLATRIVEFQPQSLRLILHSTSTLGSGQSAIEGRANYDRPDRDGDVFKINATVRDVDWQLDIEFDGDDEFFGEMIQTDRYANTSLVCRIEGKRVNSGD